MRCAGRLLAIFAFAALAAMAHAQTASTLPTIHVNAHETVVDITVTDSKGNPVRGLKQSDFAIKEDGTPQTIRSLVEGGIAGAAPVRPLRKLPPNMYTNARPTPPSGAENIILLDGINLSWPAFVQSRLAAVSYINSMPPGTDIALMELTIGGLRVLHEFTADPSALLASLDETKFFFASLFQAHLRLRAGVA